MFFYSLQLALGYDVRHKIAHQWDIDAFENWKEAETTNNQSVNDKRLNGIRLCCNPLAIDDSDTSILLYTDIKTQERLARLKRAYWYFEYRGKPLDEEILDNIPIDSYQDVKDPKWPAVESINDFESLSTRIQEELINDFNFPEDLTSEAAWKANLIYDTALPYNGVQVDPQIVENNLSNADYEFILQDVVNTKFKCVCDALGIPHTKEVEKHVDDWVAMHPQNIQKLLQRTI